MKVSKSDFKADFKKEKHDTFKRILRGEFYMVHKGYESWTSEQVREGGKLIGYKRIEFCKVSFSDLRLSNIPNKFWYAVPEGLIDKKDVPSYAGLMYAMDRGPDIAPYYKVIKPAPFIHKRVIDLKHLLFDKYFWDRISMEREIFSLKRALSEITKLRERDSAGLLKAS